MSDVFKNNNIIINNNNNNNNNNINNNNINNNNNNNNQLYSQLKKMTYIKEIEIILILKIQNSIKLRIP